MVILTFSLFDENISAVPVTKY